jgi:two-component system cell cycle response regulator DivK
MIKKILIVDDNEANLEILRILLKRCGYQTIEAKNGSEGIRLAMEENPHLILLDIQMPIMDGFEALKFLKKEPSTKNIPSIAITSYPLTGGRHGFLDLGFDDYIPKPINMNEFVGIIGKHLGIGV